MAYKPQNERITIPPEFVRTLAREEWHELCQWWRAQCDAMCPPVADDRPARPATDEHDADVQPRRRHRDLATEEEIVKGYPIAR